MIRSLLDMPYWDVKIKKIQCFIIYDRGKIFNKYNGSFLPNLSKYLFLKKSRLSQKTFYTIFFIWGVLKRLKLA